MESGRFGPESSDGLSSIWRFSGLLSRGRLSDRAYWRKASLFRGAGWLIEAGQEWRLPKRRLVQFKLQYRSYRHDGWNYAYISVQVGAGVPLPW